VAEVCAEDILSDSGALTLLDDKLWVNGMDILGDTDEVLFGEVTVKISEVFVGERLLDVSVNVSLRIASGVLVVIVVLLTLVADGLGRDRVGTVVV